MEVLSILSEILLKGYPFQLIN